MALCEETSNKCTIDRIEIPTLALKLNSTSVIVYHKEAEDREDGIQPEDLFDTSSRAVRNNPHNYLTLLSLEMKDRLREDFSVIGNTFANIDERAFLHHLTDYKQVNEYQSNLMYDFHYQELDWKPGTIQFKQNS